MGQCTSCSTQRPNFSSSIPQTPEYELNPESVFATIVEAPLPPLLTTTDRLAPTLSTCTTCTGKIHPALKIRSKIKKSQTPLPTTTTALHSQVQENVHRKDDSMNITQTSDSTIISHRKPSKKHRVSPSPQTTDSTARKSGIFLWGKSSSTSGSDQADNQSNPSVLLRKFLFLQTKTKSPASAVAIPKATDNGDTQGNNKESVGDVDGIRLETDNNNTTDTKVERIKTTKEEKNSIGSVTHILSEDSIPISAVTLNALNSNRQEKKQLRDLFLFGTTDTTTNTTSTVTNSVSSTVASGFFSLPLFIAASEMDSKRTITQAPAGHVNVVGGRGSPSFTQQQQQQPPPEKVKRTFQYQSPKQSSAISSKIAVFNLNQRPQGSTGVGNMGQGHGSSSGTTSRFQSVCNTNVNRQGENPRLFGTSGNQVFRVYPNLAPPAPKTLLTTTTTANTLVPISEQNNNITTAEALRPSAKTSSIPQPRSNYTTLKKPVEPKPFYTLLYPARNQNQKSQQGSVPTPTTQGAQAGNTNTGVILQRKMFSQLLQRGDEKSTAHGAKTRSISASSVSTTTSKKLDEERNVKMNYPLQHDGSSSSGEFSKMGHHHHRSGGGGDHQHHAVSDSEYLDDEISDQPDLTLTFKDLTPSSSGESLASCEVMLDKRVDRENSFQKDGDMASDSAFSDTSSAKAIPTSTSAATRQLNSIDRLASPKHRARNGITFAPKVSSPSKPKSKSFILKNLQVSSPKDCAADGKKMNSRKEIQSSRSAPTNEIPSKNPKHVSPSRVSKMRTTSVEKASPHRTAELVHPSLPPDENNEKPMDAKDLLLVSILDDMVELKRQLLDLREVLDEKDRIAEEKDNTIEKLMLEIDILKRNNNEQKIPGVGERLHNLHLDCEPATANAAAQTDSDMISPVRGISHDEDDKFGELVSFRIGRRVSPSMRLSPDTSSFEFE